MKEVAAPEPIVLEECIISTEEGEAEEELADNEVIVLERNNPRALKR